MRSIIFQDWTTVHCTQPTVLSFTQPSEGWLDLSSFADATFWIDVSEVVLPSGDPPSVQLLLQTSPTLDETYFMPAAPPINNLIPTNSGLGGTVPIVLRTVRSASTAPLARFLRWQLNLLNNSGGTPSWGATFRIRMAPSAQSFFVPTQVPGCVLWLRSDLGITLDTSGNVEQWTDQTGDLSKTLSQSTPSYRPTYIASNAAYNGAPTLGFSSVETSAYMVAPSWTNAIAVKGFPRKTGPRGCCVRLAFLEPFLKS